MSVKMLESASTLINDRQSKDGDQPGIINDYRLKMVQHAGVHLHVQNSVNTEVLP